MKHTIVLLAFLSTLSLQGCFSVQWYRPPVQSAPRIKSMPPMHARAMQQPKCNDSWRVNLFPIFFSEPRQGGRKTAVLWPLLRVNTSPLDQQFALWPLYQYRVAPDKRTLALPFFVHSEGTRAPSFTKMIGAVPYGEYTDSWMVYPLYYNETVNGPSQPCEEPRAKLNGVAGIYGHGLAQTTNSRKEIFYFIPPFFKLVSVPDGYTFKIWPFYSTHETDEESDTSILWPLYRQHMKVGEPTRQDFLGVLRVQSDDCEQDYY